MDPERIPISVVIPTCNRKLRLLSLLENLNASLYRLDEVIIVDSSDEKLQPVEYGNFRNLSIQYIQSLKSVCVQRNIGIRAARSSWIFLCDDDIEIPSDYLVKITNHIRKYSEAGAVSGLWLELQDNEWKATHPILSSRELWWKYIFQLGIWGEIKVTNGNVSNVMRYYNRKGNHISKGGWPVNINFNGEFVLCPVYSLGATLVKKEWLVASPFDETLDRFGIGDNYGVTIDFPSRGIQVVTDTFVHHHLEQMNRVTRSIQYYRRILALDYFIRTKKNLNAKRRWLLWSLVGNGLNFTFNGNGTMAHATAKAIWKIMIGANPYFKGSKKGIKVIEPTL